MPKGLQGFQQKNKLGKKFQKGHKGHKYWLGKKRPDISELRTITQTGRTGEKANHWKGGITPLTKQIRNSFKYRQWRSDVFTRDDFTCQNCGIRGNQTGGYLEAHHHIKEFSEIIKEYKIKTFDKALNCEELWNINNGITLCKKCHNLTKHGGKKK